MRAPAVVDTDQFGTFTGDVARTLTPIDAARPQARLPMEAFGVPKRKASEVSYGPLPGTANDRPAKPDRKPRDHPQRRRATKVGRLVDSQRGGCCLVIQVEERHPQLGAHASAGKPVRCMVGSLGSVGTEWAERPQPGMSRRDRT